MQSKKFFGFGDFETCFDLNKINEINKKKNVISLKDYLKVKGRVYLAGWTYGLDFEECKNNYQYADNKESFLNFINNHLTKEYEDPIKQQLYFYFHNLNFDFEFIRDNLLNDFKDCTLSMIGKENDLYQYKLRHPKTKNEFILLDSTNILRVPLAKFPEFDGFKKRSDLLEQDMSILRPLNHVGTKDEIEYLYYDVMTLASGVFNYFKDKFFHLTTSSYAFKVFMQEIKRKELKHYFNFSRQGYIQEYDVKRLATYCYNDLVGKERRHIDINKRLQRYSMGGQNITNPEFQEKILHNVKVLDDNGLYSYAFENCKVPYISNVKSKINRKAVSYKNSNPIKLNSISDLYDVIGNIEGKSSEELNKNYFLCFTIIMDIELKDNLNFSPVTINTPDGIIKIHEFIHPKVRSIKKGRVVFAGSEYDLKNWKFYYHITNCELVEYFIFDIMKGQDLRSFRDIMTEWSEKKIYYSQPETYDPFERDTHKLLMNSLTGKFGEKIRPYITTIRDNQFIKIPNETNNSRCLPLTLSITSFARFYMSYFILKGKDKFIYSDTDSITLNDITEGEVTKLFQLHDTQLGLFRIQKRFVHAIYMKPKTYVGVSQNKLKFTVAGCKVDEDKCKSYTLRNLLRENKVIGVKVTKAKCDGGMFLINNDFIFKGDNGLSNNLFIGLERDPRDYINTRFQIKEEILSETSSKYEKIHNKLNPPNYRYSRISNDKDYLYDSIIKDEGEV